ncbi:MAG: D-glycero-D-manno-heptose 1,7-bisphosphate phosphatase [Saprospiraceae bacterium]|jgi:D-glycero-D-manno-heptose 1,7-bisphosphate phosphatase
MPNYPFLFLDRDGVINERLPDQYVERLAQFQFTEGALAAISNLTKHFDRIVVVTNQQGIGKGIMTVEDLKEIHDFMKKEIEKAGGHVDAIYFCPALRASNHPDRKPNPGMAMRAKQDFPEIDFSKSIIVGDANSDMLFGKRLGMKTILIETNPTEVKKSSMINVDARFISLAEFSKSLG